VKRLLSSVLLLAMFSSLAGLARADVIFFKKEFGGGQVKCEIYKEEQEYIYYVDIKRNMDCGCARQIIDKIEYDEKDLINVEEFFEKKALAAKDENARRKAEDIAAELRKKRQAKEKADKSGKKKKPKINIRSTTTVKVLKTKDSGSNELLVDPFPEDPDDKASKRKR
jgi:hypothetical protein